MNKILFWLILCFDFYLKKVTRMILSVFFVVLFLFSFYIWSYHFLNHRFASEWSIWVGWVTNWGCQKWQLWQTSWHFTRPSTYSWKQIGFILTLHKLGRGQLWTWVELVRFENRNGVKCLGIILIAFIIVTILEF